MSILTKVLKPFRDFSLVSLMMWVMQLSQAVQTSSEIIQINVHERDNIEIACPTNLLSRDLPFSSLDWFLNGNILHSQGTRFRFSSDRNTVFIDNVRPEDEGIWTIRPYSKGQLRHSLRPPSISKEDDAYLLLPWCNFTLNVLSVTDALSLESHKTTKSSTHNGHLPNYERGKSSQQRQPKLMHTTRFVVKYAGGSVTFRCPAYGIPSRLIHWKKNSKGIQNLTRPVKRRKWSLKLNKLTPQDSGEYKCTVANKVRNRLSFSFNLTVLTNDSHKPILFEMENITVRSGDTVRLNCKESVHRHLITKIEWLRRATINGSTVDSTGAPIFEELEIDNSDEKNRQILLIENVTVEDNGQYFCVVKKRFGNSSINRAWLITVDTININAYHYPIYSYIGGAFSGAVAILLIASIILIHKNYRKPTGATVCTNLTSASTK